MAEINLKFGKFSENRYLLIQESRPGYSPVNPVLAKAEILTRGFVFRLNLHTQRPQMEQFRNKKFGE